MSSRGDPSAPPLTITSPTAPSSPKPPQSRPVSGNRSTCRLRSGNFKSRVKRKWRIIARASTPTTSLKTLTASFPSRAKSLSSFSATRLFRARTCSMMPVRPNPLARTTSQRPSSRPPETTPICAGSLPSTPSPLRQSPSSTTSAKLKITLVTLRRCTTRASTSGRSR